MQTKSAKTEKYPLADQHNFEEQEEPLNYLPKVATIMALMV